MKHPSVPIIGASAVPTIIPLGHRLLGRAKAPGKTSGGLYTPDTVKRDDAYLEVLALGEPFTSFGDVAMAIAAHDKGGAKQRAPAVGDTVCITGGLMVHEQNGDGYFMVNYHDVVCIIKK